MQRIGVLGGMSPQATMDLEVRIHRVAQRLIPQNWTRGYPPMVVWYNRTLPIRVDADNRPLTPREIDPSLLDAAAWLGKASDFLVIPCNAAHVGVREIAAAAGCPVLSMIDVTIDEVARRGWFAAGVVGFGGPPGVYIDPLKARGVRCDVIDAVAQARLDAAIRALMEGREALADTDATLATVDSLRGPGVSGVVLGCTEIPLLLREKGESADLINPAALLADAAVRRAMASA